MKNGPVTGPGVRRRGRRGRVALGALAAFVVVASAVSCSTKGGTTGSGASSPPSSPRAGSSSGASPSPGGAAITALPVGCDGVAAPPTSSVVSFAAGGRVWSFPPDSPGDLHCLFTQADPGLFSWGPRGDRVVLAGLEVRGVGSAVSRPAGSFQPAYFTWSRPTGTTLWFTDQGRTHVFRADIGSAQARDITPIQGTTYGDIAYHPSGLAVGFVTTDPGETALWMSTNLGTSPQLLVRAANTGFGHTGFGHIVFAHDGTGLYYSIDRPDGTHALARYDLTTGRVEDALWKGTAPIDDVGELAGARGVALTTGASCDQRQAVYSSLDGTSGTQLAPSLAGPVSMVGRLDQDRFVVAAGGCSGAPQDVYLASLSGGPPTLLVKGVNAVGMRTPEPSPPPPLPQNLPRSGFA